jgi:hypothetical protein
MVVPWFAFLMTRNCFLVLRLVLLFSELCWHKLNLQIPTCVSVKITGIIFRVDDWNWRQKVLFQVYMALHSRKNINPTRPPDPISLNLFEGFISRRLCRKLFELQNVEITFFAGNSVSELILYLNRPVVIIQCITCELTSWSWVFLRSRQSLSYSKIPQS